MSLLGAHSDLARYCRYRVDGGYGGGCQCADFLAHSRRAGCGASIQGAISAGYDRAFVSILDANVTTLIVALILFLIGSGPVQGFAVTLSIGILTSMFTCHCDDSSLVNLTVGGRKIEKLWI